MKNSFGVDLYRGMVRCRTFEERVGELFVRGGTAGSMLHLSIGEEGPAVGVGFAMKPGDMFTTHHRGHSIFMARGADPNRMMAEIAGATAGYCAGKGGSMHIADMALGHLGANAIVGGGAPSVVGSGLAVKHRGGKEVSVAFFGDGAMQQGIVFESFNMAALWQLPVMFVAINNQYGMGTRIDRAAARLDFEVKAASFGLRSARVDGTDVEETHKVASQLLDGARKGEAAFLMVDCYRFYGHARKDKSPYRDEAEELAQRDAKDAIAFQRKRLVARGEASDGELDGIDTAVADEMNAATDFALASQRPTLDVLYEDVFGPGEPMPESVDSRIAAILAD
jgi:acetoin:2,6-dichlorophenolindophenol oxidoreductase subunit alpha